MQKSNNLNWKTVTSLKLANQNENGVRTELVLGWVREELGFGSDPDFPCHYKQEVPYKNSRYDVVLYASKGDVTKRVIIEVKTGKLPLNTQMARAAIAAQLDKYADDNYADYLVLTNMQVSRLYKQNPGEEFMENLGEVSLEEIQRGGTLLDCLKVDMLLGEVPVLTSSPAEVSPAEFSEENDLDSLLLAVSSVSTSRDLVAAVKSKLASAPFKMRRVANRRSRALKDTWASEFEAMSKKNLPEQE